MEIRIDPSRVLGKCNNFFNHIHFHPTDAIEDGWGRAILDRVCRDGAARTVRMYAMLEDIVTLGEDGALRYDFTENDVRLDYLVGQGLNILLSYNFIPPCISSDPEEVGTVCKNPTRYKGKFISTAEPRSFDEWEEICRTYTAHIVERYGAETVRSWQLQCYNEPDEDQFYMKKAGSERERAESYCRLYRHFVRGVHAVDPSLRVGGPALGSHFDFLGIFLDFVKAEGLALDYLFFHTYGVHPSVLSEGGLSVSDLEEKARKVIDFVTARGFTDVTFINDEWGAATCGYFNSEENPCLMFRETEVFAAYFAKLITRYREAALPIEKMLICLSGQHEMRTDFSGFRGFFTLNGYPKPIYNAFVLAGRLGDELIAAKGHEGSDLSVFPTKRENGSVALLLSYASPHFDPVQADLPLRITLAGGARRARLSLIDRTHASAMHAYALCGSPSKPSDAERERIDRLASLSSTELPPSDTVELTMTANSVALLELFPEGVRA